MSTTYEVTAKRWTGGWELHVDGVGVTQVRTLDNAEQQVRDYLETEDENLDASAATIVVTPDLDGLEKEAEQAQHRSEAAQHELIEASMAVGEVVERLRSRGLSVTDVAAVLKVSRGRISQISGKSTKRAVSGKSTRKSVAKRFAGKTVPKKTGSAVEGTTTKRSVNSRGVQV